MPISSTLSSWLQFASLGAISQVDYSKPYKETIRPLKPGDRVRVGAVDFEVLRECKYIDRRSVQRILTMDGNTSLLFYSKEGREFEANGELSDQYFKRVE